ncbi:uncharacterized protein I303_108623 [Kwoniella dejecticola CBS 10117]|uniref:Uncharacterized protein n=1 Tax=Kwoniella dejecticola CBS 10117 TaxID=1296121 RepID=A0A1A5ZWW6_9TREE|nr:uncharacterized protein I303_07052 [Kwoniella dejecticola CBS 10117]OBR82293.1 hypothetical protein I303_07052 [Kwoniella dejecticola CBS 10117]
MVTAADIGPISSQYSAAATVPLIKSPSLWLPKPIEMPNDIHPLPEDITAYFVYPFTLEEHVLSVHPSPAEAISARRARNAEILHQREVEEEQKEKDALRRIAPGYNPASVLLPSSNSPRPSSASVQPHQSSLLDNEPSTLDKAAASTGTSSDPMDDLVLQLEQMESKRQ